jgi:CHAT domain-containing protein/Tfp pilus assembly protein PilF
MAKNRSRHIQALTQRAIYLHQQGQYEQAVGVAAKTCALANLYFGQAHPVSLLCLSNLAMAQHAAGQCARTIEILQRILVLQQEVLTERHPDRALTLQNLASVYLEQECYDQAEPLLLTALAIWQAPGDGPQSNLAACQHQLALLYDHQDRFEQAIPLYRQAIDIWKQLPAEKLRSAQSLDNSGLCLLKQGENAQAIACIQEALEVRRAVLGEQHPAVAANLHELGLLLVDQGDYQQATIHYRQALALYQHIPGAAGEILKIGNRLAIACFYLSNYTEAEESYQQVLALHQTLPESAEYTPDLIEALNGLAGLYRERGTYTAAEHCLQQALARCQAHYGQEHPQTATSLDALAGLYRAMGNYPHARTCYQQALLIRQRCLGPDHPDVGTSLNNLALFYYDMDETDRALPLLSEALEIARRYKGNHHPDVASALSNLATILYEAGQYTRARPLLEEALTILRRTPGVDHPETARAMNRLASLYHAVGETTSAEQLLLAALRIRQRALGERSPGCATNLQNLARLYAATGRPQEALALKKQAMAIEELLMGQIFALTSESQRQAYVEILNRFFDSFLSLVFSALAHSQEALQQALELALRRKSIGIEALAVQQEAVLSGRYPELAPALQELAHIRMQIARALLEGPPAREPTRYQQQLEMWQQQRERLEIELARIPEMRLTHMLEQLDRRALCRRLPPDAVLIEFVRYEVFDFHNLPHQQRSSWKPARYAALVVHADAPEQVQGIDLGAALPLAQQVNAFRAAVIDPLHILPVVQAGSALRTAVFDPLLPTLQGKTRLVLAPAGILYWLPFEVLPAENGTYLIDRYQISYLGTGRDLGRQSMPHAFPAGPPCVIADPDFDLRLPTTEPQAAQHQPGRPLPWLGARPFARLAGTRKEGRQIAKLLGVAPLLGKRAVETALKACHSPRILHIATHGFFFSKQPARQGARRRDASLPDLADLPITTDGDPGLVVNKLARFARESSSNPLVQSGLIFAGANTWNRGETPPPEAEDGIFTAEDVAALDLRGTALVVLSACETGLGREIYSGEGMPGLRRAFVLAGAKTLVTSLWKVPDRHTQELMGEFYQRVLGGQGCAQALREACFVLKTRYPHPFFWGAFICQGDPGPLQGGAQALQQAQEVTDADPPLKREAWPLPKGKAPE